MRQILIIFFLMFSISVLPQSVMAIGIALAPSELEVPNGLKGMEYTTFFVVMNTANESATYNITVGGAMANWITIFDISDLNTSITQVSVKKNDRANLAAKIKIPSDAANGNYTSEIAVESISGAKSGSSLNLKMAILVKASVTGDEILSGVVKSISASDTEENIPAVINVEFENTGNVVANPLIDEKIFNANNPDKPVGSVVFQNDIIEVNKKKVIQVPWDTKGQSLGDYNATLKVNLGGNELATKTVSFKILPVGTLTRSGNISKLYLDTEKITLNVPVKVNADFTNTGSINTMAKFNLEVYDSKNQLVDTVSSDEALVMQGSSKTFNTFVTFKAEGDYKLKGKIIFGGKETNTIEYPLKLNGKSTSGFDVISAIIALILILTIISDRRTKK